MGIRDKNEEYYVQGQDIRPDTRLMVCGSMHRWNVRDGLGVIVQYHALGMES